jgi:large subunit ribosomal protein L15
MVVNKRKKNQRQRGGTTHGWGAKKKHRGAGHRGGRGRAGSGKRADQNKPSIWKDKNYFGKHGFDSKSRAEESITINVRTLDDTLDSLVKKGLATLENNTYSVDLSKMGYNKLLSAGTPNKKMKITVKHATQRAVEAVKKAGGEVGCRQ